MRGQANREKSNANRRNIRKVFQVKQRLHFSPQEHTDSLVAAVQQLCERGGGSLGLDGLSSLFVLSQLAQDAGGHALDVLDGRVQQLQAGTTPA